MSKLMKDEMMSGREVAVYWVQVDIFDLNKGEYVMLNMYEILY